MLRLSKFRLVGYTLLSCPQHPTEGSVPMSQSTSRARKLHTNGTQHLSAVTIPLHDNPQCRALPLDAITLNEQLCSRADGLREDVIEEYREALQRGDTFPAVTV